MSNSRLASGENQGAICDRCKMSYKRKDLRKDPNVPGIMVCRDCTDEYNPYRLPPRGVDPIAMRWVRPYPQLIAPVNQWFPPGLVAPYQPVGPNDPPVPTPNSIVVQIDTGPVERPKLSESQMQEDYLPPRLRN